MPDPKIEVEIAYTASLVCSNKPGASQWNRIVWSISGGNAATTNSLKGCALPWRTSQAIERKVEIFLLETCGNVSGVIPWTLPAHSRSASSSRHVEKVKTNPKILASLPKALAHIPERLWVSTNGRFAVGFTPSTPPDLLLWDRANCCGGTLAWMDPGSSASPPSCAAGDAILGGASSSHQPCSAAADPQPSSTKPPSSPSNDLATSLDLLDLSDPPARNPGSERDSTDNHAAAAMCVIPSEWHRVYVSDDGQLVLAQPAVLSTGNVPPLVGRSGAVPLVRGLWLWERGASDKGECSRARPAITGAAAAAGRGVGVLAGTWTQTAQLEDWDEFGSRPSPAREAVREMHLRGSADADADADAGEPALAVHFRGEASLGRGCLVAHGRGVRYADGAAAVQLSTLQQCLRPALPRKGRVPSSEWTARLFALTPGHTTAARAAAAGVRAKARDAAGQLDVTLTWHPSGETLAACVSSCTGPALGGGAADARANSAFSPWVLILTADLQLVSLFEWPSAWSLRNASSTRICSAAWITDGSLLSLLDSNGNLVMLDSQGVVHSLVARRSSNGEPTGDARLQYKDWSASGPAFNRDPRFSLFAFSGFSHAKGGALERHLALSDGRQMSLWTVLCTSPSLPREVAIGINDMFSLKICAKHNQAPDSSEERRIAEVLPLADLDGGGGGASDALALSATLARLVLDMNVVRNRRTAVSRLKLRAALRSVRVAAVEKGELHAALHVTKAAGCAWEGSPAAAATWRVLAAEALRSAREEESDADARRVAVAAAEQAVRLDGYHTFKALPPNQTDSNATSRVSESLLAGDSHYLRCNWELSKQCYMDAGSGGLPSLLALQVQQHNLVGAMAVLQTAWQLTNPAALCRPEQQNPTSQAPATGRGDDLFTFQPPLRTATDRSTNVASRPKQNELVSSELCELIQVPISVAQRMTRMLGDLLVRVCAAEYRGGVRTSPAHTFVSPVDIQVDVVGKSRPLDCTAVRPAGGSDANLRDSWRCVISAHEQWGLAEAIGILAHTSLECSPSPMEAATAWEAAVRAWEDAGEWERAATLAARCCTVLRSCGDAFDSHLRCMMDCCTAVFERALNEHLKAAPVPFAKVAHIFVTSHSLLSDYISGEVHDRLFQQALERLADIATALCKALPFPRLSHINKSDDDGVQTSFADDAGRDGDVIRHAHTQLHQCLAACLLIMRPRLERTLEEGAFECGDWSVADSDRDLEPGTPDDVVKRVLGRILRLSWVMHCRNQLKRAWSRYFTTAELNQRAGSDSLDDVVRSVDHWAFQLLASEHTHPPLEVQTFILGIFTSFGIQTPARLRTLEALLPESVARSVANMKQRLLSKAAEGDTNLPSEASSSRRVGEAAPESSARAERSPEQLDVGTKSAAARSYLFTSAERLRQFAAHDACLLQKRELDSPGMDGPLQLALDVALSAGGTQASDDHFKLPPAPLLASCIKDPLIECNVTAGVPELCEPASPISGKIPASPLTLHIVEKAGMDVQAPDSTQMNPEDGPCDSTHSAELSAPVDSNAAGDLSANEDSQVIACATSEPLLDSEMQPLVPLECTSPRQGQPLFRREVSKSFRSGQTQSEHEKDQRRRHRAVSGISVARSDGAFPTSPSSSLEWFISYMSGNTSAPAGATDIPVEQSVEGCDGTVESGSQFCNRRAHRLERLFPRSCSGGSMGSDLLLQQWTQAQQTVCELEAEMRSQRMFYPAERGEVTGFSPMQDILGSPPSSVYRASSVSDSMGSVDSRSLYRLSGDWENPRFGALRGVPQKDRSQQPQDDSIQVGHVRLLRLNPPRGELVSKAIRLQSRPGKFVRDVFRDDWASNDIQMQESLHKQSSLESYGGRALDVGTMSQPRLLHRRRETGGTGGKTKMGASDIRLLSRRASGGRKSPPRASSGSIDADLWGPQQPKSKLAPQTGSASIYSNGNHGRRMEDQPFEHKIRLLGGHSKEERKFSGFYKPVSTSNNGGVRLLGSKIQPRLEQSNREDSNDDEEHHTSGGTAKQFESMPADIATVNDLMEEIRAVRHLLEAKPQGQRSEKEQDSNNVEEPCTPIKLPETDGGEAAINSSPTSRLVKPLKEAVSEVMQKVLASADRSERSTRSMHNSLRTMIDRHEKSIAPEDAGLSANMRIVSSTQTRMVSRTLFADRIEDVRVESISNAAADIRFSDNGAVQPSGSFMRGARMQTMMKRLAARKTKALVEKVQDCEAAKEDSHTEQTRCGAATRIQARYRGNAGRIRAARWAETVRKRKEAENLERLREEEMRRREEQLQRREMEICNLERQLMCAERARAERVEEEGRLRRIGLVQQEQRRIVSEADQELHQHTENTSEQRPDVHQPVEPQATMKSRVAAIIVIQAHVRAHLAKKKVALLRAQRKRHCLSISTQTLPPQSAFRVGTPVDVSCGLSDVGTPESNDAVQAASPIKKTGDVEMSSDANKSEPLDCSGPDPTMMYYDDLAGAAPHLRLHPGAYELPVQGYDAASLRQFLHVATISADDLDESANDHTAPIQQPLKRVAFKDELESKPLTESGRWSSAQLLEDSDFPSHTPKTTKCQASQESSKTEEQAVVRMQAARNAVVVAAAREASMKREHFSSVLQGINAALNDVEDIAHDLETDMGSARGTLHSLEAENSRQRNQCMLTLLHQVQSLEDDLHDDDPNAAQGFVSSYENNI